MKETSIRTSIAPWLTVKNGEEAAGFYRDAFDAIETYRLETPGGLIVRLSVSEAQFWVSGDSQQSSITRELGGGSIRMILTTNDPDTLFARALKAGASEVFPVGEDHGWRLGRLIDPYGLHWEIGYPLSE